MDPPSALGDDDVLDNFDFDSFPPPGVDPLDPLAVVDWDPIRSDQASPSQQTASSHHLCFFQGCERSFPGHGFPRRYNLFDHMKRVHGFVEQAPRATSPTSQTGRQRKQQIEALGKRTANGQIWQGQSNGSPQQMMPRGAQQEVHKGTAPPRQLKIPHSPFAEGQRGSSPEGIADKLRKQRKAGGRESGHRLEKNESANTLYFSAGESSRFTELQRIRRDNELRRHREDELRQHQEEDAMNSRASSSRRIPGVKGPKLFVDYTISEDTSKRQNHSRLVALTDRSEVHKWRGVIRQDRQEKLDSAPSSNTHSRAASQVGERTFHYKTRPSTDSRPVPQYRRSKVQAAMSQNPTSKGNASFSHTLDLTSEYHTAGLIPPLRTPLRKPFSPSATPPFFRADPIVYSKDEEHASVRVPRDKHQRAFKIDKQSRTRRHHEKAPRYDSSKDFYIREHWGR